MFSHLLLAFGLSVHPVTHSVPLTTDPDTTGRTIRYEFNVAAPARQVWEAWTTERGLTTFFAPAAKIELRPLGQFEIYFNMSAAPGQRGSEGTIVLAVQPERMLTTTWNAPSNLPEVRAQHTVLIIRLQPTSDSTTQVSITNSGYGTGGQWDASFRFFAGAWSWVAASLQYRFETGPIEWSHPPNLNQRAIALGGSLAEAWIRARPQRSK